MAFTIDGLISNITGSVQNLINTLSGKPPKGPVNYPTDQSVVGSALNTISQQNWNNLPAPYSFAVYDIFLGAFSSADFSEFQLPLAPGKINQTEHPAKAIKSTQGGTVVSHSGNKYKTLNISGTTGVAPFRGASGVNKQTGAAIFSPAGLKYLSGYEVFLQLRNYLKAYDQFKNTTHDKNYRLVWKNYKDGEFLIVELIDFQMDRTAPRSFLYDYNITFKVLGAIPVPIPAKPYLNPLQQASAYLDTARGVFLGAQDILRQVEATYEATIIDPLRKLSLAIKALQGVGTTAGDVSNQAIKAGTTALVALGIQKNILNLTATQAQGNSTLTQAQQQILAKVVLPTDLNAASNNNPSQSVINLGNALSLLPPTAFSKVTQDAFAQEQIDLQTIPRSQFEDIYNQLSVIQDNAADFFNLGSAEYNAIFNRTSTVNPSSTQVITDQQFDVLNAFNLALSGIQIALSSDIFFKSPFSTRIQSVVTAFNNTITLDADTATIQIILPQDTDLERLALTYLGDPNRWPEIAELNDLRLPFIIQDQSDTTSNVLHPGQKILIPILPTFGFSQLPVGAEITSGPMLDALEKNLGADLKLTDSFDLALGNDGDLQVIQSSENLGQAIALKLAYEPGELISHPSLGVGLDVGTKFPDLSRVQDALISSMMQDSRISAVTNISLRQENSSLFLNFQITVKQVDTPIPLTIKVA